MPKHRPNRPKPMPPMLWNDVQRRASEHLKRLGHGSKKHLACKLGVRQPTVSKILHNKTAEPRAEIVLKLARWVEAQDGGDESLAARSIAADAVQAPGEGSEL